MRDTAAAAAAALCVCFLFLALPHLVHAVVVGVFRCFFFLARAEKSPNTGRRELNGVPGKLTLHSPLLFIPLLSIFLFQVSASGRGEGEGEEVGGGGESN